MSRFVKDFTGLLSHERNAFLERVGEEDALPPAWYGYSFQLPGIFEGKMPDIDETIGMYESLFKKVVLRFGVSDSWVIFHEYRDYEWLPSASDNLPFLRSMFLENGIKRNFTGGIVVSVDELLAMARELILYPLVACGKPGRLYWDLNISNSETLFIIKISGHYNVDFLSTDKVLMDRIEAEDCFEPLTVRKYRRTERG